MFLFEPEFVGFSAVVVFIYRKLAKVLAKRSEAVVRGVSDRQTILEKQYGDLHLIILRIELVVGMQSESLSESEVLKMVDVYHGLGGNSYISRMCDDYIAKLRREREEDEEREAREHNNTKVKE